MYRDRIIIVVRDLTLIPKPKIYVKIIGFMITWSLKEIIRIIRCVIRRFIFFMHRSKVHYPPDVTQIYISSSSFASDLMLEVDLFDIGSKSCGGISACSEIFDMQLQRHIMIQ